MQCVRVSVRVPMKWSKCLWLNHALRSTTYTLKYVAVSSIHAHTHCRHTKLGMQIWSLSIRRAHKRMQSFTLIAMHMSPASNTSDLTFPSELCCSWHGIFPHVGFAASEVRTNFTCFTHSKLVSPCSLSHYWLPLWTAGVYFYSITVCIMRMCTAELCECASVNVYSPNSYVQTSIFTRMCCVISVWWKCPDVLLHGE